MNPQMHLGLLLVVFWIASATSIKSLQSFFQNFLNEEGQKIPKTNDDVRQSEQHLDDLKKLYDEDDRYQQRSSRSEGEEEEEEEIPIIHPPVQIHDVALDTNDTHHLYWQVDYSTESLRMEIHSRRASRHPWIAIGFSGRGDLPGTDACVFWVDWKLQTHFDNVEVNSENRLRVLQRQECHNFRYRLNKGILKFTFTRLFSPCSKKHYRIERGTTHLFWAWGEGPLFSLDGVLARGDTHGVLMMELLKPNLPHPTMNGPQELDITSQQVALHAQETTYWCTVVKLPAKFATKKHHILKFGPKIQKGNEDIVHHMEVFHCEHPPNVIVPEYQGSCHANDRPKETDACKRVIAAWAMGALPFSYPDEAGAQIGGNDFNPFVMLEVHYNNPHLFAGRIDSSGITLTYSSHLRKHDAGIMELGLEYTPKMAIPPRMDTFSLTGFCIPECTAVGLPSTGFHIFGSQFHTHLTGISAHTKHYRGDQELEELNRDNHYSTHFQEIRRLPKPVQILPGDALITTCDYKTSDRSNITLGGFSIRNEMCVNYVHYYPKIDLEVCKSSVDSNTLVEYFDFLNKLEFQSTFQNLSWTENYNAVHWTPLRSLFLQNMYNEAPLSMQCNRSSGERFPGFWENKEIPMVLNHLRTKTDCNNNPPRMASKEEVITV